MSIDIGDTTAQALRRILSARQPHPVDDPNLYPSAVLLLLFQKDGAPHLLFNRRSQEVEYHKGEICFPGGGKDPEDPDPLTTALRETREEMGVLPQDVDVLGTLDKVATRTGFVIHPYVGEIHHPYPFQVNTREVAEVLEVPLATLLDPKNLRREWHLHNGVRTESLAYSHGPHIIFGATANIVTNFLSVVADTMGRRASWTAMTRATRH